MLFAIKHTTSYRYEPATDQAALRLKLYPATFETQRVMSWRVSVNDVVIPQMFANGFGDGEAIWTTQETLDGLEIRAEGVVETQESSGVVRGLADFSRPGVFLRATELTEADDTLRALAAEAKGEEMLARLHALSALVSERVVYTPNSTHAETSALEALKKGKGVCQDQAHVFIAAARAMGAPARYVAGYLAPEGEALHETHAWAEAWTEGLGWVGFDPANKTCPTAAYVRLACGFDAREAAPIRGCINAGVRETLSADVEMAAQQSQQQSQ